MCAWGSLRRCRSCIAAHSFPFFVTVQVVFLSVDRLGSRIVALNTFIDPILIVGNQQFAPITVPQHNIEMIRHCPLRYIGFHIDVKHLLMNRIIELMPLLWFVQVDALLCVVHATAIVAAITTDGARLPAMPKSTALIAAVFVHTWVLVRIA